LSPVQRGRPLRLVSRSRPLLGYHLYLPENQAETGRVLVSVHGVSRNAAEHIALFRELSDAYGVMLVVPEFEAAVYRDYQRLGRKGIGPRADLALIRVLNEVGWHTGADTGKIDLFGFSGGAQFVHRFAYLHSQRVRRIGLGAAGWYTMPDPSLSYPYGAADAKGLDAGRLNVVAMARVPTLVMVGDLDNREDDEELNRTRVVRRTQGRHRVERAVAWTRAMNAVAERVGLPRPVDMVLLPGVDHSFRQAVEQGGLACRLYQHCYGAWPASGNRHGSAAKTAPAGGAEAPGLAAARQLI
jgi:pimeloyl-ACP methyl ester carboxylesterase